MMMNRQTKMKAYKTNKTKLMITATMCAALLFGATACNNGNDANGNSNLNGTESPPAVTDEMLVPTETAATE
ncbi:hypothetical protein ACX1C1_23345 [Paenibacillus sp. strain BS8-2]